MAIEFDASATKNIEASSTTWTHTVTTGGSDRILLVSVGLNPDSQSVSSITYAGEALTKVDHKDSSRNIRAELWYIVNPATGANTVSITLSGSCRLACVSHSYTGVDTNDPIGTSGTGGGGIGSATVDITAQEGWLVVDAFADESDNAASTQGAGQTRITGIRQGGSAGQWNACCNASYETGASTVTMSWTSYDSAWAYTALVAVPLKPAPAGRTRLADYFRNSNDPKRRIFKVQGGTVPLELLKFDAWTRSEGPFLPTAKKHTSLIREPAFGYNESISYKDDQYQASIQTVTETQLESLFRRLGARGA